MYKAKGFQSVVNDEGKTFAEIAGRKAAEADKENGSEKTPAILDLIGAQAPDEVRQAWMEAAKGMDGYFTVGGSWVSSDGKHSHMTQMGVQIALKWAKGEMDQASLLGDSVESAVRAVVTWIYDVDHPLIGQPARSVEEQQMIMKERAFYESFLERLLQFSGIAGKNAQDVSSEVAGAYPAGTGGDAGQERTSQVLDMIGAHSPDAVRQAYLEAEKETGGLFAAGGLWISDDGKHAHMTQLGVQIAIKWAKGELDQADFLGSSVESAIRAIEKWLYDLNHPLAGQPAKSIEQQRLADVERKFYESFLDR